MQLLSSKRPSLIRALLAASILASGATAAFADEGSNVLVMRRAVATASNGNGQEPPVLQPGGAVWRTGDWSTIPGQSNCSNVSDETRTVECVKNGAVVEDAQCVAAKPSSTQSVEQTPSCYYNWKAGPWSNPEAACGNSLQTRTMECARSDGEIVAESLCSGTPKGSTQQQSVDYSSCSFSWSNGAWSSWDSACSATSKRTRAIYCVRADGTRSASEECENQPGKPSSEETQANYSGCSFEWEAGPWQPEANGCGAVHQTREIACKRSDGTPASTALCSGTAPTTSQDQEVANSCSFDWVIGEWSAFSGSSCGAKVRTRPVSCLRSDGAGGKIEDCNSETRPAATESVEDLTGCGYEWTIGKWTDWSSACSADASRTRTLQCARSDGRVVDDAACGDERPRTQETATNYAGCRYQWQTSAWQVQPGCGQTTQTREASCFRSDGEPADEALCGAKPALTGATTNHDACGFQWVVTSPGQWSSTCSANATRSVQYSCVRSDGEAGGDKCGTAPSNTESAAIYTGCTYSWAEGEWGEPLAACGATTSNRNVSCLRSDGAVAEAGMCDQAAKPSASRPATNYENCQYSWSSGEWGSWSSTCSAASIRTRPVACTRSDGNRADDSSRCSGPAPASSETLENYSSCSYEWEYSDWAASHPSCGSVEFTRTAKCVRQDGQASNDALCSGSSKESLSRQDTDTRACTYAWASGEWGDWSSTCSAQASHTRSVTCMRSDNTPASEGSCTGTRPPSSEAVEQYSGCSYSWQPETYGAWSDTCSRTATRSINYGCQRSDGTFITGAAEIARYCTAAKPSGTSAPTLVTDGCEKGANTSFSSGTLAGWGHVTNVRVVEVGGKFVADMSSGSVSGGSNRASLGQDFPVVNGRQYEITYELTGRMANNVCTSGVSALFAIWRFPNGRNNGASGNWAYDQRQICGQQTYRPTYRFTANYTGVAQALIWMEVPYNGAPQVLGYLDKVSIKQLP